MDLPQLARPAAWKSAGLRRAAAATVALATAATALAYLPSRVRAVGLAALYGIGLVRSRRCAVRYAGAALFFGWAELGIVASLAVVAGASLALWPLLFVAPLLAAGGLSLARAGA